MCNLNLWKWIKSLLTGCLQCWQLDMKSWLLVSAGVHHDSKWCTVNDCELFHFPMVFWWYMVWHITLSVGNQQVDQKKTKHAFTNQKSLNTHEPAIASWSMQRSLPNWLLAVTTSWPMSVLRTRCSVNLCWSSSGMLISYTPGLWANVTPLLQEQHTRKKGSQCSMYESVPRYKSLNLIRANIRSSHPLIES